VAAAGISAEPAKALPGTLSADKRAVTENFEPQIGLEAYKAWEDKKDRHPY
jgi:hypothetical protein